MFLIVIIILKCLKKLNAVSKAVTLFLFFFLLHFFGGLLLGDCESPAVAGEY